MSALAVTALHVAPLVVPVATDPVADGAVAIAHDRVVAVGRADDLRAAFPDARVRSWPGLLTPGLVNAHTHLQYTDFADLATSGLPFVRWIRALTDRRPTFTDAMWQESARRGLHEALSTGTTCVADVVTNDCVLVPTARSKVAGISYVEVVGVDASRWGEACARLLRSLDNGPAGRRLGVSPHALYSLGRQVAADVATVARERGLRLHPHAAETAEEAEFVLAGTGLFAEMNERFGLDHELLATGGSGRTPVAELDALGLLGPDVHVAHGVHVTEADRALLRSRGTGVALCPRSNAILGAGEAPVAAYLAEGSTVGIGTDSRASSPSLDVLEEARALRDLALQQGAPKDDLAEQVFRAATLGGAGVMGLVGEVGALVPGARADLAVFDVPVSGTPYDDLVEHGPGRCVGTVLGGTIVHRRV